MPDRRHSRFNSITSTRSLFPVLHRYRTTFDPRGPTAERQMASATFLAISAAAIRHDGKSATGRESAKSLHAQFTVPGPKARRFRSGRPGACLTRDDQPLLRAFAGAHPRLRWDRLIQAVPMRSSRIIDYATALLLAGGLCYGQVREAAQEELPERLRDARLLAGIEDVTAQRVRDGEWDHVVFYALQSRRFTELPPVEPGVSARQ